MKGQRSENSSVVGDKETEVLFPKVELQIMAFLSRPQGGQEIGQEHQKSMRLKDANLYGSNSHSSANLEKGTRKQPVCSGTGRL